jgi:hypothetical protein
MNRAGLRVTTCTNARLIASAVSSSRTCAKQRSCRMRSYSCLLGVAGKELTLVRCEDSAQTRFVRFEFGAERPRHEERDG